MNLNLSFISLIFYCFINLLVSTSLRKNLTYKGLQIVLIINTTIMFIACIYFWKNFILQHSTEQIILKLNSNNWLNVSYELSFKINSLNFLFILLVNIIGLATNFYILNYFKFEERSEEFILLINWFMISMIFLVISNNFFTIILGWELIGLTSFLLINFWKFKITTLACSFKAFTFNKISDIFLMLSFCFLWNYYKINNIDTLLTVISWNKVNSSNVLIISSISLMISSFIKSAQFIGHLWLPDSMEAPVPASSLIHSATLVSAGIYLLLKFQILFKYSNISNIIFLWSSFTACYGGIVAASQSDMKKLLAYSTISHCGFIMVAIMLNNFVVTVSYLYLHGLFKAVTFFCAGSLIKSNNTQDMRYMGSMKNNIVNILLLIISAINLGGLPFTLGYLYKQLFLNILIINYYNIISYGFCIIGLLCSVVYVYKLIYFSCFDFRKGFLNYIPLYLQNYKKLYNKEYLTFNYIKLIAFLIIHLFSLFFFIIVKYYFLKNFLVFYYSPELMVNNYKYLMNLFFLKQNLLKLFYIFFSLSILLILFINWRENYFYHETNTIKLNIISIIIFINITSNSLNFIINLIINNTDIFLP